VERLMGVRYTRGVVATGAEVESTIGKRRSGQPRAWAPSMDRHPSTARSPA
jgi:hypothetical protein